ncbi:hypothetical protein IPH92_04810 [Candidatus Kaiserbacteria bacterium]|nr:MAG: hypothetical protein IPH92_04810 [Candidatus Kaiserbacteria bacterium]
MKSTPPKTKKAVSEKVITLEQHNADIKRYIGAVAEDFQHRLSAIGEQFSSLHDKLDTHTTEITRINDKLDDHGRILNSHTEMIGRLMIDVEEIKVGMNEKVSRSEFNKLESRLVSLESFVFSKQAKTSKVSK